MSLNLNINTDLGDHSCHGHTCQQGSTWLAPQAPPTPAPCRFPTLSAIPDSDKGIY